MRPSDFAALIFGNPLPDGAFVATWEKRWKRSSYHADLAALDALEGKRDVYLRATLVPPGLAPEKRGNAADAVQLDALWLDIDVRGTPDGKGSLKTKGALDRAEALRLANWLAEPSLIVDSGFGIQPWWIFSAAHELDRDGRLENVQRFVKAWEAAHQAEARSRGYAIDSTADLARLLRLPGTLNAKGAEPVEVRVVHETERRYGILELVDLIKSLESSPPASTTSSEKRRVKEERPARTLDDLLADPLLGGVRRVLDHEGHPPNDESASGWDGRLAYAVAAAGLSREDFRTLAREHRQRHGAEEAKADRDDYIADHWTWARQAIEQREAMQRPGAIDAAPSPSGSAATQTATQSAAPAAVEDLSDDRGLDDVGNAARFAAQHGHDVRHLAAADRWLTWDGARWAEDDRLDVVDRAQRTARALIDEAAATDDRADRDALLKHAHQSGREVRIRAMLNLARPRLVVRADDLDRDPWLLTTPRGTLDLHTGELKPHDRADLITRSTAVSPGVAVSPTWAAFLERVLPDPDVRAYVQRLAGLSLVGNVREHVLPILWGVGANGKSTLVEALRRALGDYAHSAPLDLLMQARREGGGATPELAQLRGRRLVIVSETREDGRLAAERVKAITGGDPITARPLYSQPITFRPSHTVWLLTNYRPRVTDDGEAMWRRLALVPFTVTIPAAERDPELGARLEAEAAGVLRWMLDGCLDYQRRGLAPPAAVQDATAEYRSAEDTFGAFLEERTRPATTGAVQAGAIHAAYQAWAAERGMSTLSTISPNAVADRLAARGYESRRTKVARFWIGLELVGSDT